MELRQLRYFARVLEEGSVSRASRALHSAQPALSQQIRQLEQELGVDLFTRSVRGVEPTAAGMAVYQQTQQVLKHVEATRQAALHGDAPSGPVSLGLPWTVTELLGLRLLQEVRTRYPSIQLEVTQGPSGMLGKMLGQGKLDIAVVFGERDDSIDGLEMRPVADELLLLIGAVGTIGSGTVHLSDIQDLPLLTLSRPNGIREAIERLWQRIGCSPNIIAEINAPALLVQAVQKGLGYSLLPACGIELPRQEQRLDVAELADTPLTRRVFVCNARHFPLSPAARIILELVLEILRDCIEHGRWQAKPA